MNKYERAKERENNYHNKLYVEHKLFRSGTWLARPLSFVTDSFGLMKGRENAVVLDLGSGIGRHSIPLAEYVGSEGHVICIDRLSSAILGLEENAKRYFVRDKIIPVISDIDMRPFTPSSFDFVLSISCLEHVPTVRKFAELIRKLQFGTKKNGVHCFSILMDNKWYDDNTLEKLDPLVELELDSPETKCLLKKLYKDWKIKEISTKSWETLETFENKKICFLSNCIHFLAIKT
jgi:ubiquinone/menaquinone biosynthesis C-methylase UbiE